MSRLTTKQRRARARGRPGWALRELRDPVAFMAALGVRIPEWQARVVRRELARRRDRRPGPTVERDHARPR